jgi:hypothetical protein
VALAGGTHADLRAFGRAIGNLAIEQECEPFGVGEIPGGILLFELEEGIGHAVEAAPTGQTHDCARPQSPPCQTST